MKTLNTKQKNALSACPILFKEWHPTKNEPLTPDDVTVGSGKQIWWMCDKGHEWTAAYQ